METVVKQGGMELADQYLLEIIKWGSLTSAAKQLGVSQPALSLALTNLEKKLGYSLVDRKSKPICPTEEGSIYIEYLQKRKELTRQLQKEISDVGLLKKKALSVGGAAVYIESLVANVIPKLLEQYPECHIDMRSGTQMELVRDALNGEIECFICTDEKHIPDNFTLLPIRQERLYLCVPEMFELNDRMKEYQVQLGEERKIEDYSVFSGEPFITLPSEFPLQRKMNEFFLEQGIALKSSICVDQVSIAVSLAKKGMGIVVASEEALMGRQLGEDICLYSLPQGIAGRKIYIAYDSRQYISKVCKLFIDLMTKGREEDEEIKKY